MSDRIRTWAEKGKYRITHLYTPMDWARFQYQAMPESHFFMLVDDPLGHGIEGEELEALMIVAEEVREAKGK